MDERKQIVHQLNEIDKKLSQLKAEQESLLIERQKLLQQDEQLLSNNFNQYAPVEDKIELFLSYFKGRPDIYPFRWESKNGRSGYSPACWNEWQPKICNKPKISCSDCNNQNFKVPDKNAIFEHLKGIKTIGIYPLLTDNTTYLLAADFDKTDWFESIIAFASSCETLKIPYILERSRSGNGGHIWIFFSHPVQASDARKLGNALLSKTMDLYPSLSFDCFDRLFPNQDIMPEGGFGNLIALPLQFSPRQLGNSVFIDKEGLSYSDQWAKLASIEKLSSAQLSQYLTELIKTSSLIDETTSDDSNNKPWQRSETLKSGQTEVIEVANCPEKITLVLANQVYIPISNLPGKITSSLKRCAVFANPEFFKRQALRFSTIGTSRYICAAHIESSYLILPRGCLPEIENILSQQKIEIEYDNKRFEGMPLSKIKFNGKLKSQQAKAVTALLDKDNGVFVASTGFGKTVTGLALIAKRKINTLILVHNRQLAEQWLERIKVFLTNVDVGSLLGGKDKLSYQVDVATYQSLVSRNGLDIKPAIEQYGQIIIDECHHLPASNYEALIKSAHARYIHGLTATPKRQDGLEKLMHFQLGGVVFKATTSNHKFEQHVKVINTIIGFPKSWEDPEQKPHISEVYKYLVLNQQRNQLIIKAVIESVNNKRTIMILTERKEHITILAEMLTSEGINVIELHGSISAKQRQQRIEKLQQHDPNADTSENDRNNRFVILATGKYVGEGFDLPYLDTLFITLPIAWKGILAQYAGRIQREWSTKKVIQVYDFVDDYITLKRMWAKREKGYKALGYTFYEKQGSLTLN